MKLVLGLFIAFFAIVFIVCFINILKICLFFGIIIALIIGACWLNDKVKEVNK